MIFIAVGTPSRKSDGHADLSCVYASIREVAKQLTGFSTIVMKSTVPVGTGDEVEKIIKEARPDAQFSVVSNPEFLREGAAIADFLNPDRMIIGTQNAKARKIMGKVYASFADKDTPILYVSRRTSELTKYAANALGVASLMLAQDMEVLAFQKILCR